jgi:hypothetical protein
MGTGSEFLGSLFQIWGMIALIHIGEGLFSFFFPLKQCSIVVSVSPFESTTTVADLFCPCSYFRLNIDLTFYKY